MRDRFTTGAANRRRKIAVLVLLFLATCTARHEPPAPTVDEIRPTRIPYGPAASVAVLGTDFYPRITRTLQGGEPLTADETFQILLIPTDTASMSPISLQEVALENETELQGTVPADTLPGRYTAQLIAPDGQKSEIGGELWIDDSTDTETASDTGDGDTDTDFDTDSDSDTIAGDNGTDIALRPSENIFIDGYLTEPSWRLETPIRRLIMGDTMDLALFDLLWTDQYLYIGVLVNDDQLRNDSIDMWDDDAVEFVFDGNYDRLGPFDVYDDHCIKGYFDIFVYCQSGNTAEILHASARYEGGGGYAAEIALPWSHFGLVPYVGMTFGFDIGIDDDDGLNNDLARDSQLRWAVASDNWWDTSLFGAVTLSDELAP